MIKKIFILTFLCSVQLLIAQEVNIVPFLKNIENGQAESVKSSIDNLLKDNPNDPSLLFVDAVLTEDGTEALNKYQKIFTDYPQSKYADAALYRAFSYYYSLGIYGKASNYLASLKEQYPNSPYIKAAERTIPEEDIQTEEVVDVKRDVAKIKKPEIIIRDLEYNFTVQAGAFLNFNNAKQLKEKLSAEGYPTALSTKEVGGSFLNIVTAGKFKSEESATKLLEILSKKYKLNGRIIPLQ